MNLSKGHVEVFLTKIQNSELSKTDLAVEEDMLAADWSISLMTDHMMQLFVRLREGW